MANEYLPRVVDSELKERLDAVATVVVEGPRACGKTETARRHSASEVLLDIDENARRAAEVDPGLILAGDRPRLIDEWQTVPRLWNHVRRASDTLGEPGQFILTGSAVPPDDTTRHTGAGRISRVRMRPMTLVESGYSTGASSLGQLLRGEVVDVDHSTHSIEVIAALVARGGWPGTLTLDLDPAIRFVRDYLDEIRRTDIVRVDGSRRDADRVQRLFRSLARNVATEAAITTLASDTSGADDPIHPATVSEYLGALERLFVVEDQPAWSPALRSRSRLRSSAKRHFVDPSLAVAALRAAPDRLLTDLKLFGFLFESLVIRDLRVYGGHHDASVYHYRDGTGLEIDAVVESAAGSWVGVEVKLGGDQHIEDASENLLTLAERIHPELVGPPSALVVVTLGGYGYRRTDGVWVIPISTLGP